MLKSFTQSSSGLLRKLLLLGVVLGALAAAYGLFASGADYRIFTPLLFTDTLAVPFAELQLENLQIPLEVDHFLIFQDYQVSPALPRIQESLLFGLLFVVLASTSLALFTKFSKLYFVAGGIAWILVLTLSNLNGLDIIAPSSNYSLILLLVGTFLPTTLLYIWGQNLPFISRWLLILTGFGLTFLAVRFLSPVPSPELFLSFHLLVPALGFSIFWLVGAGYGVISGVYALLARANQSVGMRISIQLLIVSLIYLSLLFALLLALTGETDLPIPTFNPLYLLLLIGGLGWIGLKIKSETAPEMSSSSQVIQSIYLLGFALVLWTVWKVQIDSNEPASALIKHILVYSQIGFSIFFLTYLYSNFLSIMDSGQVVDRVMFKPYSLPFYHVRIGGLIGMMVLIIYTDGIVGVQVNSLSNNILGDYYYASGQPLEASILYENSWFRYRKNGKAKQNAAQLLFELNQPTRAKLHLEESFAENPQVDNIILLAQRLHRENKPFESIFYLENGLKRFPESAELANNLALFYTKIGRQEEAITVLDPFSDPVSEANKMGLRLKTGDAPAQPESGSSLIEQINSQTASRRTQKEPMATQGANLLAKAFATKNPMLVQAAARTTFALPENFTNTEQDLRLLDSLTRVESYADYIMSLQETASLRSLSAGRIGESIKNLKGLAFRNPGDAAYYLQLSADILALQLDFDKASTDLIAALQKGFQDVQAHHIQLLRLAEENQKADSLAASYGLEAAAGDEQLLAVWQDFHELMPREGFTKWEAIEEVSSKQQFGKRLLMHKSHGLSKSQLQELAAFLSAVEKDKPNLKTFISNPDFTQETQLRAFMNWLTLGEELSANPYLTPLILAAADRLPDPLAQYELLNAAGEFNRDPILWIQKVNAARKIGLANYATAALEEMKEWVSEDELLQLQLVDF